MKKIKVAVIFGGTNTEHEVSIVSARSVIQNLDKSKYTPVPIKITKKNIWIDQKAKSIDPIKTLKKVDVAFPVIHGPFGEDGTLQGMLEMANIPYVGCGVLASAICMDKATQKSLCLRYNIPTLPFYWFTKKDWHTNKQELIKFAKSKYSYPLFIKPSNQGSSVGISKANNEKELISAINFALKYDTKVIIEQGIENAREIECSILGNHNPKVSVLGEIISSNDFYDYDAKYIDGSSQEVIPAKIPKSIATSIKSDAIKAYQILSCSGLARADFLYDHKHKKHYLSELNTMPGFTSISMYPKLWQATGIGYPELLDKLIKLGLEKHKEKSKINYSYKPKTNWHKK
jgi:D-alanine-D-alanine ligase